MGKLAPILTLVLGCGGSKQAPPEAGPSDGAVDSLPPACASVVSGTNITMRKLANVGEAGAMLVTSPPNDPRLFVVERTGTIRIIEDDVLKPTPFLDISMSAGGVVSTLGDEMGLLGLAFDPNYATNGELYVFYTALLLGPGDNDPSDNIVRYKVSADPDVADPASATPVLALPRSRPNHNGGMMEYGADGFLYIGTGDGGSAGDPIRNGQDPNKLHGKMLRIDTAVRENGKQYGIPAGNPFAQGGGAPEVYMLGLRNPWRWSFDRATGDMWIGDVGQGQTEELDFAKAGEQAGKNFGWSAYEGNACCAEQNDKCFQQPPQQACDPTGKTFAIDTRSHLDGWLAIIGGQVYRGSCYPDLVGWYFYTDSARGGLVRARMKTDGTLEIIEVPGTFPANPSSLHADARGELYETDITGNVYRLEVVP